MTRPAVRTDRPFAQAAGELLDMDGRTLRQLAPEVGMSYSHLSRLIAGTRKASTDQIETFARALGVPGSYFLEVRLARINEQLVLDGRVRDRLWDELSLRRD